MLSNARWIIAELALGAALLAASPATAHAQTASSAAETLFQDGKALLARGQLKEACEKLAASHKLEPAVGALAALGACYEKDGRTAAALTTFRAGLSLAQSRRDAREKVFAEKIAELEPSVPTVLFSAAPGVRGASGVSLELDTLTLDLAVVGSELAVDPGAHRLTVRAPQRAPRETTFTVKSGERGFPLRIELGPPADASGAGPSEGDSIQKPVAIALMGAGALGLGLGTFFGIRTLSLASDAKSLCRTGTDCADYRGAQDRYDSGKGTATAANVFFGLGLAAAGAGVVLYVLAPSAAKTGLAPAVGPGLAGASYTGSFR